MLPTGIILVHTSTAKALTFMYQANALTGAYFLSNLLYIC